MYHYEVDNCMVDHLGFFLSPENDCLLELKWCQSAVALHLAKILPYLKGRLNYWLNLILDLGSGVNFEFAVISSMEAIWILMKLIFSPPLLSVNKAILAEIIVLFDRVRLSKLHNITISVITGLMGNNFHQFLYLLMINLFEKVCR